MATLLKTISTVFLSLLTKYFGELLLTLKEYLKYLNGKRYDKQSEERKDFDKKVDNIVDNGNIEDLVNLKK